MTYLKNAWDSLSSKQLQGYRSIKDLPIGIWWDVCSTNDRSLLLGGDWEALNREFIEVFGVNETYKEHLQLLRDIAILRLEKIIYEDASYQTLIDIKQFELKQLGEAKGATVEEVRAYISKEMGFRIDEKTVTVYEYYSYLKLLEKQNRNGKKD